MVVPSSELGSPTPSPPASVSPLNQEGRGHTRQGVRGVGGSNSDDSRKSLVLCLLCGDIYSVGWILPICEIFYLHIAHCKNVHLSIYLYLYICCVLPDINFEISVVFRPWSKIHLNLRVLHRMGSA
jgi:hypothetical protein